MATKAKPTAAPAKTTAIAKAKVALPANINEQFANEVAALQKRIAAPTSDRIAITQSKTFKINGAEVDTFDGVIVDFVAANFYYATEFDRNNIVPPDCFAIGLEPAGLAPSDNSPDKQCESCAGCWANQYKSARNGRGKACTNAYLLAVLPVDATEDTPISIMKVTSKATSFFSSYVQTVALKYGVPTRGVITTFSFADEEYASPRFAVLEKLGPKDELLAIANSQRETALTRLQTEPDVSAAAAANDKKPVRAPARKVAGRR